MISVETYRSHPLGGTLSRQKGLIYGEIHNMIKLRCTGFILTPISERNLG